MVTASLLLNMYFVLRIDVSVGTEKVLSMAYLRNLFEAVEYHWQRTKAWWER
jgi:hypothetical protein